MYSFKMPAGPRNFPRELVRDLLGLVRALYRAELDSPPGELNASCLRRLEEIGQQLRQALELGARCGPGTLGRRAAWSSAEAAAAALGELSATSRSIADAANATAARMRRRSR